MGKEAYLERARKRFIKNSLGQVTQIRTFSYTAVVGSPVSCTNFSYDNMGLIQNIWHSSDNVSAADLVVP